MNANLALYVVVTIVESIIPQQRRVQTAVKNLQQNVSIHNKKKYINIIRNAKVNVLFNRLQG